MTVVAVTGASGFVGERLVSALADRGHDVRAIARRGRLQGATSPTPTYSIGEINAGTAWGFALSGVEVVIHCAARAHVMREHSTDPYTLYRDVNVNGTRRLAEEAVRCGVRRLVFLSSVKAVGERSVLGRPLGVLDEPRPEDDYGRSKVEAELALKEVSASTGLEIVIVRPPLVYGPGVKGNFLRLLGLVARGVPLPFASINNARSMVSLANLVDFLAVCVDSPAAAGKTFFVSDGDDLSTTELVRKIAMAMNKRARLLPVPVAMLRVMAGLVGKSAEIERLTGTLQVDINPNRDLLGWSPRFSVDAGLRETADWFLHRS
jgi:nucleoside-diphosphate-sugar epimerase